MRTLLTAALAMTLATPANAADTVHQATQAALPQLMDFYRDFHANPELSLHEVQTAAKLSAEARKAGYEVTEKVGGTGVVAVLKNGAGPILLIRADMDGLPVTEDTGLPFASKVRTTNDEGIETGVMHACGHDTHMASWIGTLRNLAAMKSQWKGTLVMIAQPAEERGMGARMMLEDGLFTRFPKPQFALAFHDAAALPAGTIGVRSGYALANVDSVDIKVSGVGGHGAYPQTTRDPIVLAARIVTTLQTLVSREIDPQDAAVVTVGAIHGGSTHNIIGKEVTMLLTVRSYTPEVRKKLLDGIARIAKGEAIAAGIHDPQRRHALHFQHRAAHRPPPGAVDRPLRQGPRGRDARGDGRRGFRPLLPRRQVDTEHDLLGRRRAQGEVGRRAGRQGTAALAPQSILGARGRSRDRHRHRSDDRRRARYLEALKSTGRWHKPA
jgi:amidohydrolase